MQDFIQIWKELSRSKKATFTDTIIRALLIGLKKGEDLDQQARIAQAIIERGLTPITNTNKLRNGSDKYQCLLNQHWQVRWTIDRNKIFNTPDLVSEEERKQLMAIWDEVQKSHGRLGVHYSYIFLYGDLMPEQRCIQMAHAAMKMGQRLTQENRWPAGVSADNLHYAMVAPQKKGEHHEETELLDSAGIDYIVFVDHDYSFGEDGQLIESPYKSVKAIMTYPIHHSRRKALESYELYRFE